MTILVTGATGKVGRQVLAQLSAPTRAFSRTTGGDVTDVDSVRAALAGVDKVFLVWPFFHTDGLEPVVSAIAGSDVRRVVYLSSAGAPEWAQRAEALIERTGLEWTMLQPTGFAGNALQWSAEIKEKGVVRAPFGELARPLIHEYDIAAVGVRALTSDAHIGAKYELSGPELVTQIDQVRIIGEVIGRDLRFDEQSPAEARTEMLAAGWPENFADEGLAAWAGMVENPEPVTSTLLDVTGSPGRTFREWVRDNAAAFTA